MSTEALKLGAILHAAQTARTAIGIGCLSSDPDRCERRCGGHRDTGWTLDPKWVIGLIGAEPVGLVEEGRRMAQAVDDNGTLAAGLVAAVELQRHGAEGDECPRCERAKNVQQRCGEWRRLTEQVEAALKLAGVAEVTRA